jgi:hypothetical protein
MKTHAHYVLPKWRDLPGDSPLGPGKAPDGLDTCEFDCAGCWGPGEVDATADDRLPTEPNRPPLRIIDGGAS